MKLRIFFIEKNVAFREAFRAYFERLGHEVVVAEEPSLCSVYNGHQCDKDDPCGDILIIGCSFLELEPLDFIQLMAARGCKGSSRNKLVLCESIEQADLVKSQESGCEIMRKPVTLQALENWILQRSHQLGPERKLTDLFKPPSA